MSESPSPTPTITVDLFDLPRSKYALGVTYLQENTEHIARLVKTRQKAETGKRIMIQVDDGLGGLPDEDMTLTSLSPLKKGDPEVDNNSQLIVCYSRKVGSDGEYTIRWKLNKGVP